MKITFKVEGLREADEALKRLHYKATRRKVVRDAWVRASKPLLDDIKANAPVDTGDLKRSIRITRHPEGDGPSTVNMQIGVIGEFHGHFQEFGTSRQPARPFVRPAVDRHSPGLIKRFAAEIKAAVDRFISSGPGLTVSNPYTGAYDPAKQFKREGGSARASKSRSTSTTSRRVSTKKTVGIITSSKY